MTFLFQEMNVDAIKFFVEGPPVGQPRHSHRVIVPKDGRPAFVHLFIPSDHPVHTFKEAVRIKAKLAYRGPLLTGPLRLTLLMLFRRPQHLKTGGRKWAPVKPDRDNVEKAICDALKGIVWKDDNQVCDGPIRKMYAASDEQCGVEVMIEEIE